MNVNTGELTLIAENPGNIAGWITDNDGKLRVATTTDGVNTSLLYRETEADPFQVVVTTSFKDTIAPLFFTFDNKHLYVSSNIDRDKQAIFTYDPETGGAPGADLRASRGGRGQPDALAASGRSSPARPTSPTSAHYHFFDDQRRAAAGVAGGRSCPATRWPWPA